MFNLSAAMGPRWAEICIEFNERIKKLGPSPVRLALEQMKMYQETDKEENES